MPRVANPPRARDVSVTTPRKQSHPQKPQQHKVPLNDDRQEKAARLQSRHALHDLQMNTLKAATSPVRKLNNYNRAASDSPKTPRSQVARGKENIEHGGLAVVAASAMTPIKRVPILANFEEWMKMATDNKINATNSWNFALIDYFHDMSLLKEGDGVNFQKASCTLDGCVKIYTSRVDSVATETGKLLSGLADSGNKKNNNGQEEQTEEGEEGAEEDEGEDGVRKKSKRKAQRSSEATLAPSFASLQLKKMELEFSVDPLFKKVAADFDEGGAKGLLLNHLNIDANGRIVFDSSDDAEDATAEGEEGEQEGVQDRYQGDADAAVSIDIDAIGLRFFPELSKLEEQDICPSLRNFDLGNPAGSLDIPFLKAPEDWKQEKAFEQTVGLGDQTGVLLDGDDVAGFDDDDGVLGGFDLGGDAGFGEGGEAWAKTAAIELQTQHDQLEEGRLVDGEGDGVAVVGVSGFNPGDDQYAVSMHHKKNDDGHENILSYFDNALQKTWAGPEHWRIRKIKDLTKASAPIPTKRKEKEPFEINFNSPLDPALAELIFTPAGSNSAISLPKAQWRSKTRNLLPDDKHFNSRQLLQLFLKPKARMGQRRIGHGGHDQRRAKPVEGPEGEIDEAFWASNKNLPSQDAMDDEAPQGNYDANFFQDDALGFPNGLPADDEEFADAREAFSPGGAAPSAENVGIEGTFAAAGTGQEGAFGTQLVTQSHRLRPEYVQYARVAKKVDVRKLKEEMWKGIGFNDDITEPAAEMTEQAPKEEQTPLKFTSVMNKLQQVYPQQAMADISTSYCFICLLHLANEKGLSIDNQPGLEELDIRRDMTAEITEGDA